MKEEIRKKIENAKNYPIAVTECNSPEPLDVSYRKNQKNVLSKRSYKKHKTFRTLLTKCNTESPQTLPLESVEFFTIEPWNI